MSESEVLAAAEGLDGELSNVTRLLVLSALYIVGPMYESDLARLLGVSWGKLSTHLRRLEEAGYVSRRRVVGEDRPRVLVMATELGVARLLRHLDAVSRLREAASRRKRERPSAESLFLE
ncbi:MAG: transcriptional regulator [Thermoprotei archaeon]|nr:MAG: transcriptional regulator [Thermoprotei archaeon]